MLASAHGTGHEGAEKTLHRFRADFHTSGTRSIVCEFMCAYIT
jgi:hypothetical protein